MYDIIGGDDLDDYSGAYDLIGADMLVGADMLIGNDDMDALLGAPLNRFNPRALAARNQVQLRAMANRQRQMVAIKRANQLAAQQAAAIKRVDAGAIVRERGPQRIRNIVLPMSTVTTVAAGATATVTARPQTIAFRPSRLSVPGSIGPSFLILDLKVGNVSQLAQSGELAAETFNPLAVDAGIEFDTVQTSMDFVIQVQNISGAPAVFRATVFGRAAE